MKPELHDSVRRVIKEAVAPWSHAEVAKLTGINKTSVTRMLNGQRRITLDALYRFSKALHVKASTLVLTAESVPKRDGSSRRVARVSSKVAD